jgi:hypothetical protein
MSFINKVINTITGANAPEAAAGYDSQVPSILKQYYNPFFKYGESEMSPYKSKVNELMENPTGFVNGIMKSYKPSQEYKNNMSSMLNASDHAAAAGGTLGTGEQKDFNNQNANKYSMADQQQYLQSILQPFYHGMQGAGGIVNTGFGAAQGIAQGMTQSMNDQGALAEQGAEDHDRGIMGAIGALATL